MTKRFDEIFNEAMGDSAIGNLAVATDKILPEVGDIMQVQVTGNLDPQVNDEKVNLFGTYRVKDIKGKKIVLELSDMIQGVKKETFVNPLADLDETYYVDAGFELADDELTIDIKKVGEDAFNYMHDNIWSVCIIDADLADKINPQMEENK